MKKHIKSFFKKRTPPSPFLPDDTRVYCVGDIHGRNDLLQQLLVKILDDAQDFRGRIIVIYLGDFIDRGSQSKETIDTLLTHKQTNIEYIYLRGNHEQVLLDSLNNPAVISTWLSYGGLAALASYGVAVTKIPTKPQDLIEIQQQLKEKLPSSHYQFFSETTLSYTLGSYFFVHAGISPKYSLARQQAEDLLWIRDDFIQSTKNYEKIVVHGHTITKQPELLANRIGIDTGAYSSGVLTCLVLELNQQRILQTNE